MLNSHLSHLLIVNYILYFSAKSMYALDSCNVLPMSETNEKNLQMKTSIKLGIKSDINVCKLYQFQFKYSKYIHRKWTISNVVVVVVRPSLSTMTKDIT